MKFNQWLWIYWAEKFPSDIVLITNDRQYFWCQLAAEINSVADHLQRRLVAPQQISVML
ncbi:MAG TPA: hypothetical protein ACHBX0_08310 [Arsenophonus sp.]